MGDSKGAGGGILAAHSPTTDSSARRKLAENLGFGLAFCDPQRDEKSVGFLVWIFGFGRIYFWRFEISEALKFSGIFGYFFRWAVFFWRAVLWWPGDLSRDSFGATVS